jgi:ATP-binding cassette subfamily B protein
MEPRRRWHLLATTGALAFGAAAELITIGSVAPFLALVSNPEGALRMPGFWLFLKLTGSHPGDDLLVRASVLLIGATLAAAAARVLILWLTQSFVLGFGHDVGTTIFSRMLRQPYSYYVTRNQSELLASVEKVHTLTLRTLMPLMQAITAAMIALTIIFMLFLIDPFIASIAAGAVALLYAGVTLATRRRLRTNSVVLAQSSTARMQAIQEGVGGIRDILLGNSQHVFEESFRQLDDRYRRAQAVNMFIGGAPRYVVEAAGVVLIVLLAAATSLRPGGIIPALPELGALALGAQRLLPLIQQSYLGWSYFAGHSGVIADVLALMNAPVVADMPAADRHVRPFTGDIVFEGVRLNYPGRSPALRDVSLRIAQGERIGLVGVTGSGKSSFLDLLMGLIDPSEGSIRIDGEPLDDRSRAGWQAQIAHVPQSVYLADSSIAANIAFAEPEDAIDLARVEAAARQAQLHGFIDALPEGYGTRVGERGIRLSGGQRQRIAIARALYKRARVLIFDEATGALDRETELAIMAGVEALGRDMTVLIVAHRVSALAGCDRILRIEGGRIVESGSHAKLIGETA